MTALTVRRWRVPVVAAAAVLVASLLLWSVPEGDARSKDAEVPSTGSWRTIEHDGVEVDIPAEWERTDTDGCEFETVRWEDPGSSPCGFEDGLVLYGADLFDPAHRPGLVRTAGDGGVTWSGYAYAGDFAVYVFENRERAVVRHVLASARHAD